MVNPVYFQCMWGHTRWDEWCERWFRRTSPNHRSPGIGLLWLYTGNWGTYWSEGLHGLEWWLRTEIGLFRRRLSADTDLLLPLTGITKRENDRGRGEGTIIDGRWSDWNAIGREIESWWKQKKTHITDNGGVPVKQLRSIQSLCSDRLASLAMTGALDLIVSSLHGSASLWRNCHSYYHMTL